MKEKDNLNSTSNIDNINIQVTNSVNTSNNESENYILDDLLDTQNDDLVINNLEYTNTLPSINILNPPNILLSTNIQNPLIYYLLLLIFYILLFIIPLLIITILLKNTKNKIKK